MSETCFKVLSAGPMVSFQDEGRIGFSRYGVPQSGAMDMLAFKAAKTVLSTIIDTSHIDISAIEISLGGLELICEKGEITLALSGGEFALKLNGVSLPSWSVLKCKEEI